MALGVPILKHFRVNMVFTLNIGTVYGEWVHFQGRELPILSLSLVRMYPSRNKCNVFLQKQTSIFKDFFLHRNKQEFNKVVSFCKIGGKSTEMYKCLYTLIMFIFTVHKWAK